MKQRTLINHELKKLPIVKINYHMYDEGLIKEYGLTRNERIKNNMLKTWLINYMLKTMINF